MFRPIDPPSSRRVRCQQFLSFLSFLGFLCIPCEIFKESQSAWLVEQIRWPIWYQTLRPSVLFSLLFICCEIVMAPRAWVMRFAQGDVLLLIAIVKCPFWKIPSPTFADRRCLRATAPAAAFALKPHTTCTL